MWPNPEKIADLVTFLEEIRNGKLHFLCSVRKTRTKHISYKNNISKRDFLSREYVDLLVILISYNKCGENVLPWNLCTVSETSVDRVP